MELKGLIQGIAEGNGLADVFVHEDCHLFDFGFELRQSDAAEVVGPLGGILAVTEKEFSFF